MWTSVDYTPLYYRFEHKLDMLKSEISPAFLNTDVFVYNIFAAEKCKKFLINSIADNKTRNEGFHKQMYTIAFIMPNHSHWLLCVPYV